MTISRLLLTLFMIAPLLAPLSSVAADKSGIESRGVIEPHRRFQYVVKPGDVILEIMAQEGVAVTRGTLLARIANIDLINRIVNFRQSKLWYVQKSEELKALDAELSRKRKGIEKINAQIDLLKENERGVMIRLLEKRQKATEQVDRLLIRKEGSGAEIKTIEDSLLLIEKTLALLEEERKSLVVIAPFDGIVRRVVEDPKHLLPGMIGFELHDESALSVRVDLWQHQIASVRIGSSATIYPDYQENRRATGVVTRIEPPIAQTRKNDFPLFPVVVRLNEKSEGLMVGMIVSVTIATGNAR